MLVLTTMFINVSNSLPKTSYMKMVDAWLLFNLLYPFIVVLLHTYMDTLRNDGEREINHHGKSIKINEENKDNEDGGNMIQVPSIDIRKTAYSMFVQVKPANLVSVNERIELEAQKEYYKKIEMKMGFERARKLEKIRKVNLIYLPLMALTFAAIFWFVGLRNADVL